MMKIVSEIFHSTKDSISKKSESPLVGAFITAWVILNWQPILYFIFLDQDISAKISKVLSYKSWLDQLVYPIIIAIFYVLGLPYIQNLLLLLLKKSESFQRKFILDIKRQLLDEEHYQRLDEINKKIELEMKEKSLREESTNNAQISDLKEQIALREEEVAQLIKSQSKERKNFENRLNRDEERFQSQISNLENELQKALHINYEINQKINNLEAEKKLKEEEARFLMQEYKTFENKIKLNKEEFQSKLSSLENQLQKERDINSSIINQNRLLEVRLREVMGENNKF